MNRILDNIIAHVEFNGARYKGRVREKGLAPARDSGGWRNKILFAYALTVCTQ